MELYILRHGVAEDVSPSGRDQDRRLTPEGRKKLRDALRLAARAGVKPSLLLTSPYTRAVETARVAAEELGYKGELVLSDALVPEGSPAAVWSEIRDFSDQPQVLLSSHNPLCSELTSYLLDAPNLWIDFKKGAMARIDFDQFGARPHGLLRWMIPPKIAAG